MKVELPVLMIILIIWAVVALALTVYALMDLSQELMALSAEPYEYMERRTAKVAADYHVRFDNAYYSVDRAYLHKEVLIRASASTVKNLLQERYTHLRMAQSHQQESVVHRSKASPRELQGNV